MLAQVSREATSRVYMDFPTLAAAMDGIVRMFEEFLKTNNRSAPTITYDVQDLFAYLDRMADVSCLVCVARARACARRSVRASERVLRAGGAPAVTPPGPRL